MNKHITIKGYYAGIGSRRTPADIQDMMTNAAHQLEDEGLILRSGGATGADTAFEIGITNPNRKQIFVPWSGFNHKYPGHPGILGIPGDMREEALTIARNYHPAWERLSNAGQLLMARNVLQILGPKLNEPVLFVLCWTPNGEGTGGTGQAIRIARAANIPVFDLGSMTADQITKGVNSLI